MVPQRVYPLRQFGVAFHPLTVAIQQVIAVVSGEVGEFHQLLHHIDHTVIQRSGLHAPIFELVPRHRYGGLVGDGQKPHPTAQDAQLVDGVEALAATIDLQDGQRFALRRTDATHRQRNPVDLRFHDAGHCPVPFRRDPHEAVAPAGRVPKLRHFGMRVGRAVGLGEAFRVIDARFGPEVAQKAVAFLCQRFGIRHIAQGPVEDQKAWRGCAVTGEQALRVKGLQAICVEGGEGVICHARNLFRAAVVGKGACVG